MPNDSSFVNNSQSQPTKKTPSQGFFKTPREIAQEFKGEYALFGIYSLLMAEAAWGDYTVNLRKKQQAQAGQLITTLMALTELLGMDHRRVRRELAVLVAMGAIEFEERGKQCMAITITGTVKKNALEAASIIPPARPAKVGKCPDSEPSESGQMPRLKVGICPDSSPPKWANAQIGLDPASIEKKKIKEKEKKSTPAGLQSPSFARPLKYSPEDLEIGSAWFEYAKREMSWARPPASWSPEAFAAELAKVRAATNLNCDGLRAVLKYVEGDAFWVRNALSPGQLLKKSKNEVRKIDNILAQMKPVSLRQKETIARWDDDPATYNPLLMKGAQK